MTIKNCTVLLSIKLTILLFSVSLFYVFIAPYVFSGLPWWLSGKEATCNAGDVGSIPGLGRFPWRRAWQPTPVFLPGESHGQRNLVHGFLKELNMI